MLSRVGLLKQLEGALYLMTPDIVELLYVALAFTVLDPLLGMHSGYLHVLGTVCSLVRWLVVLGSRDLLLVIAVVIRGKVVLMRHQSRSIRKYLGLSFLDIANGSILTLGPR